MRRVTLGLLILLAVHKVLAQVPHRPAPGQSAAGWLTPGTTCRCGGLESSCPLAIAEFDSVFTDDEGQFSIADATSDTLTVRVSKAGYAASLVALPLENVVPVLRFALTRSAAVMGRVLDSAGAPAVAAYVRGQLIGPTAKVPGPSQFFTQTDALGEYRLGSLPAGRYEITAVQVRPEARRPDSRLEDLLFGPPIHSMWLAVRRRSRWRRETRSAM